MDAKPGEAGNAYHGLGERRRAIEFYEQALLIHQEVGARDNEAITLSRMAVVLAEEGDLIRAVELLELAVAIAELIEHPDLENHRTLLTKLREERPLEK
jgi:tetratricopeptide (TPR) repeat protein